MAGGLDQLGGRLRRQVVASCLEREPAATGVLVHGSYAAGQADPESDLDLAVFVRGEPAAGYRTWFVDRDGLPPLHVSARTGLDPRTWAEEEAEPADWAFGMPVELPHLWLWVGDRALLAALGERPVLRKPAGAAEVEDMVEALRKVRRHRAGGDELGARLAAQVAGRSAAPTVAALGSPAPVADPRAALEAVMSLPLAPPGWAGDLASCLGLSAAPLDAVAAAAERLVAGALRLARETDPAVDAQPEISRYLADGTLERILGW